jgi:hypothetical protein
MKRSSLFLVSLLSLLLVLITYFIRYEPFTSPGTLVQLSSSHVPDEEDITNAQRYWSTVRRDLIDMTGSA